MLVSRGRECPWNYSGSAWLASLILSPMFDIIGNNAETMFSQMRRIQQVLEGGSLSEMSACRRVESREVHVYWIRCTADTWRFPDGHDPAVIAFIHVNKSLIHGDFTATHGDKICFEEMLDR